MAKDGKNDDKEPKISEPNTEAQNIEPTQENVDESQNEENPTESETQSQTDETQLDEEMAQSNDESDQDNQSETDEKTVENEDRDKNDDKVEDCHENEAKVFYVKGYGNVNGCKTQAQAEKKAEKLKLAARQ